MNTIVIDGIFFQINEWSGIAKYWRNLLIDIDSYLSRNEGEAIKVILLVRGESKSIRAHHYNKIQKFPIPFFDDRCAFSDYSYLGNICKDLGAAAFISSYYSLAYGIPNIGMAYDYIPEHLNAMQSHHSWLLKLIYMQSISCTLSISESTDRDTSTFYPNIQPSLNNVFYPRLNHDEFRFISPAEQGSLRKKYSLNYPFLSIIGHRGGYKNINLLRSAAFINTISHNPLPIGVVMSSGEELTDEESNFYNKFFLYGVKKLSLVEKDLTCLLSCSEMLFYPSLLEGFGYPIVEAMAQGCPVITTGSTSMSEILRHALSDEHIVVSGFDPSEAYKAIVSLMHTRIRVSSETRKRLENAFSTDNSKRFLDRIVELSKTALPPLDEYLPTCLTLDGILS